MIMKTGSGIPLLHVVGDEESTSIPIIEECCDTSRNDIAFIKRTLSLIKQYEQLVQTQKETGRRCVSYSRTLFMNCCLGLLVIPREKIYGDPLFSSPAREWGISTASFLTYEGDPNNIPLNELIRHFRNALVHNHVKYHYNSKKVLTRITFEDYKKKDEVEKLTFKGSISFKFFEILVELLAKYTIERK